MKKVTLTLILAIVGATALFAQEPLRKKHFNLKNSLAIEGYDPVAYIKQNKAIEGNKNFTESYQGTTYYFSSAANRDAFKVSPVMYEPQYGGWCAYAMGANGEKVNVDPETFKIVNGKLYLFYNKFFNNTLKDWNKDEANLKAKANANWEKTFR